MLKTHTKRCQLYAIVIHPSDTLPPGKIQVILNDEREGSKPYKYLMRCACLSSSSDESIDLFEKCVRRIKRIKNLKKLVFPLDLIDETVEKVDKAIFKQSLNVLKAYITNKETELYSIIKPMFYIEGGSLEDALKEYRDGEWQQFIDIVLEKRLLRSIPYDPSTNYPAYSDIFNVFKYTESPKKIKVIILGQDPYPNGEGMGLCFSVREGVTIPPSLRNIFQELRDDIRRKVVDGNLATDDGNLEVWASQGVFLYNTALTVVRNRAGSLLKEWKNFSEELFKFIDSQNHKYVALLWGNSAKEYSKFFKHAVIISSAHPSPLSASRGFFGSRPFSKANEALKKMGRKEIDWYL